MREHRRGVKAPEYGYRVNGRTGLGSKGITNLERLRHIQIT